MTDRTEEQERDSVPTWCPKCGRRAGTCTCEPFKRMKGKIRELREERDEALQAVEAIAMSASEDPQLMRRRAESALAEIHDTEHPEVWAETRAVMARDRVERLERAAREARDLARSHFDGDAWHHARERLRSVLDRLDAALDEREGRGGGELGSVGWTQFYDYEAEVEGGDTLAIHTDGHKDGGFGINDRETLRDLRDMIDFILHDTPDPSEGEGVTMEEFMDHAPAPEAEAEITAGVEWAGEDAEDDGRGEGAEGHPENWSTGVLATALIGPNEPERAVREEAGKRLHAAVQGEPTHSDADPDVPFWFDEWVEVEGVPEEIIDALTLVSEWAPGTDRHDAGVRRILDWHQKRTDADPSGEYVRLPRSQVERWARWSERALRLFVRWDGAETVPDDLARTIEYADQEAGNVRRRLRTATEQGEGGRNAGGWDGPYPPKSSGGVNE